MSVALQSGFPWPSRPPQATVTPDVAVRIQNVAESFTEALPQTSSDAITHTVTKMPAPDTTSVVYKLYQPDSASAASSDDSNGTKNKVILGAILGPISLVVVILMLIAMWRGRGRTRIVAGGIATDVVASEMLSPKRLLKVA
jgi:hypothetical protein